MLPVVGDVAQSDGGISRGAKGKLGIAKTCLGMMLSKTLVRISHGSTHGKVRTRNLARNQREVLARHGVEQRQEGGLGQHRAT